MILRATLAVWCMAAGTLAAATSIDVSAQTSAVLGAGDSLSFQVVSRSYAVNAAAFGLAGFPTEISFAFVTAPIAQARFSAVLESGDGLVTASFGSPLTAGLGVFSGSGYSGNVSTLQGYLHLSTPLSEEVFVAGDAVLVLRNEGDPVTLGLAPYTLRQDLYLSLSGGPLSVGAQGGAVNLQSAFETPEPDAGVLLLGGGTLLCAVSMLLGRSKTQRK